MYYMKNILKSCSFFFLLVPIIAIGQGSIYTINKGTVVFHSVSANELIHASSNNLKGAIDTKKNTFVFKIDIITFSGFNNPLQREHFNENYMESAIYPQASYSGKIIEDVNLSVDGEYIIRTKGKLKIHGVEQERIIEARVVSKNGKLQINASFKILLADYNIKIPRIVSDKLSPFIKIIVNCTLVHK